VPRDDHLICYTDRFWGVQTVLSQNSLNFGPFTRGKTQERWLELCEQAAIEQDPKKLLELVAKIIRLLDEKQSSHLIT
jgi:hypothetical protein